MKKFSVIFLIVILCGLTQFVSAQKPFAGIIKSKMTCEGTTDPNILSQLPEETTEWMFGNYTKTVQEAPGYVISNIVNGDAKVMYTIFDITGMGKFYLETTEAEILESDKMVERKIEATGETKTIAGYPCEKIIYTIINKETDEENQVILYVSTALNASDAINFGQFSGVKGYPLRTEVKQDVNGTEITIISEAVEVTPSKKVKEVDFMLPADGQKKTKEEFRKMFGAGDDDEDDE